MDIEVFFAIVAVLVASIFPITLIVIVKMCLKDKKHDCSFSLNKNGFEATFSTKN